MKQFKARPYQEKHITETVAAWASGLSAITIMATGGGKTLTSLETLNRDMRPGDRALWLTHRDYLCSQTVDDAIEFYGWECGIIQGSTRQYNGRFIAATVQTLAQRSKNGRFENIEKIAANGRITHLIIDETHRDEFNPENANMVVSYLKSKFSGVKILGLTATPVKQIGVSVVDWYDMVTGITTISELVKLGYLVPPKGYNVRFNGDLDTVPKRSGDYTIRNLASVIDAANADEIVFNTWNKLASGRQTIVFTVTVKQAKAYAAKFRDNGITAYSVSGVSKKVKSQRIEDYKAGKIQVLTNAAILIEGFNAPKTSCVVMARPTQSQALYAQCVGRGLRLAENKSDCVVINLVPRVGQSLITLKVVKETDKKMQEIASGSKDKMKSKLENFAETGEIDPPVIGESELAMEMADLFIQHVIATGSYQKRKPAKVTIDLGDKPAKPVSKKREGGSGKARNGLRGFVKGLLKW